MNIIPISINGACRAQPSMPIDLILGRIARAQSVPLLWRVMTRYFMSHGFGAVSYYLLRDGSAQPAMMPFQHGLRPVEIETFRSFDFQRLNIVPRMAVAQGRPVRWSEIWRTTELTPEQRAFITALCAVGFPDGIALPCYGPRGLDATVAVGRIATEVMLSDPQIVLAHYVAQAAHLRMCDLLVEEVTRCRFLSTREKEILEWVTRGKSNGVIAEILAISPFTVDTYIRRIYDKLDVSDRTSAAVKAVRLGLVAA